MPYVDLKPSKLKKSGRNDQCGVRETHGKNQGKKGRKGKPFGDSGVTSERGKEPKKKILEVVQKNENEWGGSAGRRREEGGRD